VEMEAAVFEARLQAVHIHPGQRHGLGQQQQVARTTGGARRGPEAWSAAGELPGSRRRLGSNESRRSEDRDLTAFDVNLDSSFAFHVVSTVHAQVHDHPCIRAEGLLLLVQVLMERFQFCLVAVVS